MPTVAPKGAAPQGVAGASASVAVVEGNPLRLTPASTMQARWAPTAVQAADELAEAHSRCVRNGGRPDTSTAVGYWLGWLVRLVRCPRCGGRVRPCRRGRALIVLPGSGERIRACVAKRQRIDDLVLDAQRRAWAARRVVSA